MRKAVKAGARSTRGTASSARVSGESRQRAAVFERSVRRSELIHRRRLAIDSRILPKPGGIAMGDRPSTARQKAGVPTYGQLAHDLVHQLDTWLRRTPPDSTVTLPLGPTPVRLMARLLQRLEGAENELHDLHGRIARARLTYANGPGNDATRTREALRCVLLDTPTVATRGRTYDPNAIAEEYFALTTRPGLFTLWRQVELDLDLPGSVFVGPMDPWDAIETLANRYEFPNKLACLRFLERVRREALAEHEWLVEGAKILGYPAEDVRPLGPALWLAKLPSKER